MNFQRPISLLAAAVFASILSAQIPNGDFNQWTADTAYGEPLFWKTTNALAQSFGVDPTCVHGEPGSDGLGFAKVINRAAAGGVVLQGKIVSQDSTGNLGFAFNQRPTTLGGRCQFALNQFDVGQVHVSLTRWDPAYSHSYTVGFGSVNFIGNSNDPWQLFNINITYLNANLPDTAVITITAAASQLLVTDGSYLQVDELKFGYIGAGVEELSSPSFSMHPSLASQFLDISIVKPAHLAVATDMAGKRVAQFAVDGLSGRLPVANLAPGRYVLEMKFKDGTSEKRSFVKE